MSFLPFDKQSVSNLCVVSMAGLQPNTEREEEQIDRVLMKSIWDLPDHFFHKLLFENNSSAYSCDN